MEEVRSILDGGKSLSDKVTSRTATVCVIGLGYVGVPLSVASAQAGFNVVGVDTDKSKVDQINRGVCYVEDAYSESHLPSLVSAGKIRATPSLSGAVETADIVIVCVPTPLDTKGNPDLSFLRTVARGLSKHLSHYKLIIVESTSYPGTTEEIFQPILERGGKKAKHDFALAYSPERIDYGNPQFGVRTIPKIIGGVDNESTMLGGSFYESILQAPVIRVSGPAVAEATKMLENVFRYVNIALVNELAILHEALGVDFIEAIGAAATKPFGFMAHYPGPGVGGHCIPKDPFYLVYKAKKTGFSLRLVSAAKAVNSQMPQHVIIRLNESLRKLKKNPRTTVVALWGLAYKGEVKDTRRSPSLDLLKLFNRSRVKVRVYDPYVSKIRVGGTIYQSSGSLSDSVRGADALVIATTHKAFRNADLSEVKQQMNPNPLLFDTRNLRNREECERAGFTYMATGRP